MSQLQCFTVAVTATFILLSYPSGIEAQLPNGECTANNVSCQIEGDNLLGIAADISDLNDCLDDAGTLPNFVSHFGPAGFPFVNTCLYYSSCNALDVCEDCQTVDITSSCTTCSAPVEGSLSSNLVNIVSDIPDDLTCKQSCAEDPSCSVYTYHRANSTFSPETCFLLSDLAAPLRECVDDTCRTGLPNCTDFSICAYLDEEGFILEEGVMITNGSERQIELLTLGECPSPAAVAIGGGGAPTPGGILGGGGSGYVSHSVLPPAIYVKLLAFAGGPAEDSYLKVFGSDTNILTGARGEGNRGEDGGAGKISLHHAFDFKYPFTS